MGDGVVGKVVLRFISEVEVPETWWGGGGGGG